MGARVVYDSGDVTTRAYLPAQCWRFDKTRDVGGFGSIAALLTAGNAAVPQPVDPPHARSWQTMASLKWATITRTKFLANARVAADRV